MTAPYEISYSFTFEDGASKNFRLSLDRQTFQLIPENPPEPPQWALFSNFRCPTCSVELIPGAYCPVALNLASIIESFKDLFSFENVVMSVDTEERRYVKETSLQEGLSSLIGIVMVTSSCPVMERLKPMVRFHLPFATLLETIYRHTSMYLLAQHFASENGRTPDWEMKGLERIYSDIQGLNAYFAVRLNEIARRDANVNALVNLDCFANMMPDFRAVLDEIRGLFSAYL